jgi:hypothetical protein
VAAAVVGAVAVAGVRATVPVDTMVGAAAIVGGLIVPGMAADGAEAAGAEAEAGSLRPRLSTTSDKLP